MEVSLKTDYTQMKLASRNLVVLLNMVTEELSSAFAKDDNFNTDYGSFLASTYYEVEKIKISVLERVKE
jgi:hypothetical protein